MTKGEDMSEKPGERDEEFWVKLLDHIVEKGRRTPKVQVERAIGPILGLFLDESISNLLASDVITLAHEFPLKREQGCQSRNIDWLMYDTTNNEILLVELKTEATSFRKDQLRIYVDLAGSGPPWTSMQNDFNEIFTCSKNCKYVWAKSELDRKLGELGSGIDTAQARVIYLAPESTRDSFDKALKDLSLDPDDLAKKVERVKFVSFSDLSDISDSTSKGSFPRHRDKFFKILRCLDKPVEDYEGDVVDGQRASGKSYQGRISFEEVLRMCKENGPITVGFMGGLPALERQDVAHLEKRMYKWDWANGKGIGEKNPYNWINGVDFAQAVRMIRSTKARSEADSLRLSACVEKVLLANPDFTFGQLIDLVSSDADVALDEMDDEWLIGALESLSYRQ
jgi:hypothetical protein